jgi:mRNA-degrading endonuclease toxin of MazEF toxin-antitoxin module
VTQPHRGDIWTYQALARTKTVLVVTADELNTAGLPMTMDVTDVRPVGVRAMLATPLPGHGYILARSLVQADRDRFRDLLGQAPADAMDQVGIATRAMLDL